MKKTTGAAVVMLHWKSYPENRPSDCGKCLVELHYQSDLGLNKYLWLVNWNCINSTWEDFAGCDDIQKGAIVRRFIEDKNLW